MRDTHSATNATAPSRNSFAVPSRHTLTPTALSVCAHATLSLAAFAAANALTGLAQLGVAGRLTLIAFHCVHRALGRLLW